MDRISLARELLAVAKGLESAEKKTMVLVLDAEAGKKVADGVDIADFEDEVTAVVKDFGGKSVSSRKSGSRWEMTWRLPADTTIADVVTKVMRLPEWKFTRGLSPKWPKTASEMTAAAKDLAALKALIPELREKQREYYEKEEQMRQERSKAWAEATRELSQGVQELLAELKSELVAYFKGSGKGVRSVDSSGGLVEVFLGSDDGTKRYQSKVSCMVHLTFEGKESATFMLRNEALDDVNGTLSDKATVAKVMQEVKKADKKGFWDVGGE